MNSINKEDLHKWFMYLYEQRADSHGFVKCFECGRNMHMSTYIGNTMCYSHLVEKSRYPQFAGDPDNVKIVHPQCHHLYSMEPKKAVHQYEAYINYKKEHNL
jgi:5-methylcytosine-specific restriction endonuclease McrA